MLKSADHGDCSASIASTGAFATPVKTNGGHVNPPKNQQPSFVYLAAPDLQPQFRLKPKAAGNL